MGSLDAQPVGQLYNWICVQLCSPVSKLEKSVHCPLHVGVESVVSVTNQAEREGQTNTSVVVLPGSGPVI